MDIKNLKKAVELAQGAGECDYLADGVPFCVIGQLYVLEGGSPKDLKEWEGCMIGGIENRGCLQKYPIKLLDQLQEYWDSAEYGTESERRASMLALVEHYGEFPGSFL